METVKYRPSGLATLFGGIIGWLFARWFVKKRKPESGETKGMQPR